MSKQEGLASSRKKHNPPLKSSQEQEAIKNQHQKNNPSPSQEQTHLNPRQKTKRSNDHSKRQKNFSNKNEPSHPHPFLPFHAPCSWSRHSARTPARNLFPRRNSPSPHQDRSRTCRSTQHPQ